MFLPRFLALILAMLLLAPNARAAECSYHPPSNKPARALVRGINISQWWESNRGVMPDDQALANIRKMGFDFVRLPINPSWLELSDKEAAARIESKLRCDIIALLNHDLAVIVDVHADARYQNALADLDTDEREARLMQDWQKLSTLLNGLPASRIYPSLFNEPVADLQNWWESQGRMMQQLRQLFPKNTLVATAERGGGWALIKQKPYADPNILYDFHFYTPTFLTHHGADWLKDYEASEKSDAIAYPVSEANRANDDEDTMQTYVKEDWTAEKLAAKIAEIKKWGRDNKARLICLEFGIYRPYVDEASRHRWLQDVRNALEANALPWALWEYKGGFGLYDPHDQFDAGAIQALGLRAP